MRRVLVVVNPVAGSADVEALRSAVDARFGGQDWAYEWFETAGDGHTGETVRESLGKRLDMVVAAGGDGTVSAVADALAKSRVPLGILPTGTGNGLAQGMGIPLDLEQGLDVIAGPHDVRPIDTLRLGDRHFVLNVTVGVSARMMSDTNSDEKRRFGIAAYIWTGAAKLGGFQPHRFAITVDGREHVLRAAEVIVANSGAIGTRFARLARQIIPDDGQVDVLVVRAGTLPRLLGVLFNVLLGRQSEDPALGRMIAQRSVAIEATRPIPAQGDGETIGHTPIRIDIVPGSVRIIVPRED